MFITNKLISYMFHLVESLFRRVQQGCHPLRYSDKFRIFLNSKKSHVTQDILTYFKLKMTLGSIEFF